MRTIPVTRRRGDQTSTRLDVCGGVFVPDRERDLVAPVFTYGPPDGPKHPVFSCPVSSIPTAVWDLMDLWWSCRSMRALPLAGGALDQPVSVRRAFPIFELEYASAEARTRTAAIGGAMTGLFGGDQ